MNVLKFYKKIDAFFEEENVLNYRSGGYHPIVLGDILNEGRYKICHKLGHGGFSTVWVAKDNQLEQWVSIKILRADEINQSQELRNLRALAEQSQYSEYIVQLLDDFLHEGPNGRHQCLVFELLGPTIDVVIFDYFLDGKQRFYPEDILDLSIKLLQAIIFMHKAGYAHGDLSVKNLAYIFNPLPHLSKKKLFKMLGSPKSEKLIRLDGEALEKGIPDRLIIAATWDDWPDENDNDLDFRIIDLGNSFSQNTVPERLAQPRHLQAPELILADKFDYRVDLWNAGLIIYFLIFGSYPFGCASNAELIDSMIDFLGELPVEWQSKWEQLKFDAKENFERTENEQISESILKQRFNQHVFEPELQILLPVIQGLTKFLPSERISALQALTLIENSKEKNNKEGKNNRQSDSEEKESKKSNDEKNNKDGNDKRSDDKKRDHEQGDDVKSENIENEGMENNDEESGDDEKNL